MSQLNDDLRMPFGKYKGEKIKDVPFDYLRWFYANVTLRDTEEHLYSAIREYLARNGELTG